MQDASRIRAPHGAWVLGMVVLCCTLALLAACTRSNCDPKTGLPITLVSISITPSLAEVAAGSKQQFVVTALYSNGTKKDLPASEITWTSTNSSTAAISNGTASAGLAATQNPGTTTITATYGGISISTTLTVTAARLVSIEVTPANPSIPLGLSRSFVATGVYSNNTTQNLTNSVTWSSTASTVALVSNTAGTQGVVTAKGVGTGSITASFNGVSGSTPVAVTAATLVSIEISGLGSSLAKGVSGQLTATGVYSDGSVHDITNSVVWTSLSPQVGSVSASGLVTALTPGSVVLSATLGSVSRTQALTVTSATLVSIGVTPTNSSAPQGLTTQFTAIGVFTDGTTQDLTASAVWNSSNVAVAPISNASGSSGLATNAAIGTTTIGAKYDGITGSTLYTVAAATLTSIQITGGQALPDGTTEPLTATGVYNNGTTQDLTASVVWASSNTTVATVSNAAGSNGLVDGQHQGSSMLSASFGSVSASINLQITPAVLTSIAVTPVNPSIANGTHKQFIATGTYSDNTTQNITNSVLWSSSNGVAASVSNAQGQNGLATANGVGAATITAALNGLSGSSQLTTTAATLVSIAVTPSTATLANGTTRQYTATGMYSDGTTQNITTDVAWTASTPSVAAVSNVSGSNGLASATAQGSTNVIATQGSVFGEAPLTVTAATLVSIAITPPNASVADGTDQQFTATGTYSDGSTQNLTSQVTWASSSNAVATVSNVSGSAGLATSTGQGSATVSATLGSITGSVPLTVTAATLVSIAVTPTNGTLPNGDTRQFTATGTYTDGSTQNLTSHVTWSSSASSVAAISNASGSNGLATATAQGSTTLSAALGGVSGSTPLTVSPATLVSLAITPPNPSIAKGTTEQFTATGTYSDNSTHDLTASVTWTSSNSATAPISNASGSNGLATGSAVGNTMIGASLSGVSASTGLTVTPATLVSIGVTPTNPSIPNGTSQQFTATGTYTDHTTQNLTSAVSWSSSSSSTASVSNASGSNGVATAAAQGSTTITAQLGGVSGSTPLTVTPATLVSIGVTPGNSMLPNGNSQQYTAIGTYSDGSTQNLTSQVTWSSSSGSVAAISNASGSNGLATATAQGSTTVSAALGSVSGSTPLTVTAAALVSIGVTPSSSTLPKGNTQQFTATGTYSDGTTQNLTSQVTWASSMPAASISNAAGSNGLATAAAQGSTSVSAALGSVSGSTPLTVTAATLVSIAVTPSSSTVPDGDTEQFTAIGTYSDGSTQDLTSQVTWVSSMSGDAAVSNASGSNGFATATAQGMTTVSAALGSVSGSTGLTVSAATLVSLAITPPNPSIAKGTNEQFTATGTYSDNTTRNLTTSVSWSSSSSNTASISNASGSNGLATGSAVGTTTIGATVNGVSATTGFSVTPATLVSIAVTPTNPSIAAGTGEQFTATGTYSDGTTQDLTSAVSWSSSDTSKASVSNASGSNGLATSSNQGSTTITATLSGISGSTPLTVTAATLVSIGVTPPNPSIANGTSTSFTATGIYTDGTTQNLTQSVTWSSSNTAVATISNASGTDGLATSTGQGSTTVSATLGGVSGSASLAVTPATLVSIGVTPANPTAPKGTTEQFTATGVYTNNTTQDLTSQVTWGSSSTAVATISNASSSKGLASAAAQGSTTVTAILSGVTGSTGFTVTPAALTSIAVTPTNPSVADGLTQQFTATGTYTDNTTQNLTSAVTWSSSAPAVAAVSNASGSNGLATSQSVGSTTVTAAVSGISGSTGFTVTPAVLVSIAVTPATASIASGTTEQYTAIGTYTDGSTRNLTSTATWTSSATNTASISNAAGSYGLATSAAQGSTTITAQIGSITGSAALTVTPATLVSIAVSPTNQSIAKGTSEQYTAIGTYTDGSTQNLTSAVAWTSSSSSVASISNASGSQGLASSAAVGSTTITAGLGSITGSTSLTVTPATLASIAVTPANATIYVSATQQYVATGTYTDGSTQVITSAVTWSSSNMTDATVSNASGSNGLATGTAAGTVTITANAAPSSVSGSVQLTVAPQYAYVTNYGTNTIAQYSVGANGALNATGASVATGSNPFFVVVDPTNRYLYEVNISDNTLWQYSIGSGGALSFIQSSNTSGTPAELVIDQTGKYVYVQDIGNTVSEFSIGANGALTPIGSIATGTTPFGIRIEPTNHYLYVSNNNGGITEYAIGANGVLSLIGTASTDMGLDKIAIDPTGKYLYVTNSTTNMVEEFTIGTNGLLTSFGSVGAGGYPRTIIFDHTGKYVYAVNVQANQGTAGNSISEYAVGAGGALTAIGTVTLNGQTPFDILLDATGQFVYVPLRGSDSVAEYAIGTNGALTLIGSVATASGAQPSGIATIH